MENSYYGIEFDIEDTLAQNGLIEDYFFLQDLKQRRLYFVSEIDEVSVFGLTRHIFQYNKEDRGIPIEERSPIVLYLSSVGGSLDAGHQLIDAIKMSETPVYTVNIGHWYSMALLVGIAGHKRFSFRNAKFLLHDGSSLVYDSMAKVQDRLEFSKKEEERIRDYILETTNLTGEEYDKKYRVEWYMFSEEAKEKGFIDYIVGVDCDINEVI